MNHQPPDDQADMLHPFVGSSVRQGINRWGLRVALGAVFLLTFGFCAYPIVKDLAYPSGAKYASCPSNLKQLSMGLMMYAEDHSGCLPPAASWAEAIGPYSRNPYLLHCPKGPKQKFAYAFNSRLSGIKLDSIQAQDKVALLFESTQDRKNAADPMLSFNTPHDGVGFVAFADGTVKAVRTAPSVQPQ